MDDLGPLFALGLRLFGHRSLHVRRQIDVFDLDHRDLDAPRVGGIVDDRLQTNVELLSLGEQTVELHFTQD